MSLIKCPECNNEISDKSTQCIHCGYPLKEKNSLNVKKKNKFLILLIVILFIIIAVTIYLFSENLRDKEAPKFDNIPDKIEVKVGDNFKIDQYLSEIKITDNVTENLIYTVIDDEVNVDIPGEYYVNIESTDQAGNIGIAKVKVIVTDYPVHEAYMNAINLDESQLKTNSIGTYNFNGIHIADEEIDTLKAGSIYRSVAQQLEGYYIFGEEYYSNWGNDVVKLVWGIDKPKQWEDLQVRMDDTITYISVNNSLGEIMNRLQEVSCTKGKFNYVKGKFSFKISDLTKAAQELGITEEMFGYLLASLEEYSPETSFDGNSYNLKLNVVGQKEKSILNSSDFIMYIDSKKSDELLSMREKNYNYTYYFYDKNDVVDVSRLKPSICSTYRGMSLLSSYNTMLFLYGNGTEKTFQKEDNIIYNALIEANDDSSMVLKTCKKYVVYRYQDKGELIFYFDNDDDLVYILFTNVMVY